MEAIRCRGLSKRYGSIIALNNLDLNVKSGVIFGFLGPNGAGKTTTLRILVGLSKATGGNAWVAGEEVALQSLKLKSNIGYLPEEPAFYSWMTGREYLAFVGQIFGLSSDENRSRCDELLQLVDLMEAAHRKIGGYSRGMRQRLGIAQALVNRPEVLFLDEPTSSLDPLGRAEILGTLIRLKERATTVFLSSHILADVERVCDEVGIINKGKLIVQSQIDELQRRFARPVFEVELEGSVSNLVDILDSLTWVVHYDVRQSGNINNVRIVVDDIVIAKHTLPRVVVESGALLRSYQMAHPSLEDVFMQIVKDETIA